MLGRYLLALGIGAGAANAHAGPLTITSQTSVEQRVAAPDGTVRMVLVPAKRAIPGDKVVFALNYHNTGTQPIANLVLANPVPKGMVYRAVAAGSPIPEVSVDGKTFGTLASLRVRTAEGGSRAAGPDDVTSVRWRLTNAVAPGSQGQLAFQAILK